MYRYLWQVSSHRFLWLCDSQYHLDHWEPDSTDDMLTLSDSNKGTHHVPYLLTTVPKRPEETDGKLMEQIDQQSRNQCDVSVHLSHISNVTSAGYGGDEAYYMCHKSGYVPAISKDRMNVKRPSQWYHAVSGSDLLTLSVSFCENWKS